MTQFKVVGLNELRQVLVRAGELENKEMRKLMKTIGEPVVARAKVKMESQIHDPRSTGRLARSYKTASTARSASIVLGTPVRTAYAGWWEYGGPSAKSFAPPNREFIKEGRSLMPALAESRTEVQEATEFVVRTLSLMIMNA